LRAILTERKLSMSSKEDGHNRNTESAIKPSVKKVKFLLIFDISFMSPNWQFALLAAGASIFLMACSWVEELIFIPKANLGWFMTVFELVAFSVFAFLERLVEGTPAFSHTAPLARHALVAIAMTAARGLTNVSLQYLQIPTQVIFKSMKLITVMIGSVLMLRKSYSFLEVLAVLMLVLSASIFGLADLEVTSNRQDNMWGILVVLLSLVADAVHANSQESVLRVYKASLSETLLFSNMYAAVMAFGIVVANGELAPALQYCETNSSTYVLFLSRAVVIYCGVLCFGTLIENFGVVAATAVTTIRKIMTIFISFLLFPKPWSFKYVYGVMAFIASVVVGQYATSVAKAKIGGGSSGVPLLVGTANTKHSSDLNTTETIVDISTLSNVKSEESTK